MLQCILSWNQVVIQPNDKMTWDIDLPIMFEILYGMIWTIRSLVSHHPIIVRHKFSCDVAVPKLLEHLAACASNHVVRHHIDVAVERLLEVSTQKSLPKWVYHIPTSRQQSRSCILWLLWRGFAALPSGHGTGMSQKGQHVPAFKKISQNDAILQTDIALMWLCRISLPCQGIYPHKITSDHCVEKKVSIMSLAILLTWMSYSSITLLLSHPAAVSACCCLLLLLSSPAAVSSCCCLLLLLSSPAAVSY